MARKTTTTTTRSRKAADAPKVPEAEKPKDEKPEGRVVANKARPTRLGFTTAFRNTAEANGWTVTDLDDKAVIDNGGAHLFHTTTTPDGGVLAVKGELKIVASAFKVKDGSSNRMDAVYLWVPGATQGRRIPTVYQALETLQTGEAAAKDTGRARGPKADKAETEPQQPEVDFAGMTKPQLVAFAGERNINVPKYGSKANIVEAIAKALAA
jgi:hypothetical protein